MLLVVDASVAVKWFLNSGAHTESDTEQALEILRQLQRGAIRLVQPPHFFAEMAAVLARLKPKECQEDFRNLQAISHEICGHPGLYRSALHLSVSVGQHLFDTLYHAVALVTPAASLVTADSRYFKNAVSRGRISLLSEFVL